MHAAAGGGTISSAERRRSVSRCTHRHGAVRRSSACSVGPNEGCGGGMARAVVQPCAERCRRVERCTCVARVWLVVIHWLLLASTAACRVACSWGPCVMFCAEQCGVAHVGLCRPTGTGLHCWTEVSLRLLLRRSPACTARQWQRFGICMAAQVRARGNPLDCACRQSRCTSWMGTSLPWRPSS